MKTGLDAVLDKMAPAELARGLKVRIQAITFWKKTGRVPAARVPEVADLTGLPRHVVRPDLYEPPRRSRAA